MRQPGEIKIKVDLKSVSRSGIKEYEAGPALSRKNTVTRAQSSAEPAEDLS